MVYHFGLDIASTARYLRGWPLNRFPRVVERSAQIYTERRHGVASVFLARFTEAEALSLPRDEAIVAGFSQGAGLALGLALQRSDRPRPKATLAMSPALDTAAFDLDEQAAPPVLVQHGTNDPLIPVKRARELARQLRSLGVPTVYREYPMEHQVALESLRDASAWLEQVYAGERPTSRSPTIRSSWCRRSRPRSGRPRCCAASSR